MSWQPEVDEIRRREELAREMGGARTSSGSTRRTPHRSRADRRGCSIPDRSTKPARWPDARTYDEPGRLTAFMPSNFVFGHGPNRRAAAVVVGGDDFTVRGGAADAAIGNKMAYSERLALGLKLPMIRLVDGTGGGGSVKTLEMIGRTYVPANPGWAAVVELLGEVPVVAACLGPVAGLGAVRVATSHFSVMVRGIEPVVRRRTAGGGARRGRESGQGRARAARTFMRARAARWITKWRAKHEAFAQIRRFLSYLPSNVWQAAAAAEPADDPERREEELLSIIPRERRRSYNVRRILTWCSTAIVLRNRAAITAGRWW